MVGTILDAAAKGDLAGIQQMIAQGANLNIRSQGNDNYDVNGHISDGSTPLHIAARFGQIGIVTYLLQNGSNPNEQNNTGNTPLHMAVGYNHIPVIKALIQSGGQVGTANNEGKLPRDYGQTVEIQNFLQAVQEKQRAMPPPLPAPPMSSPSDGRSPMPLPAQSSPHMSALAYQTVAPVSQTPAAYQTMSTTPSGDLTAAQLKRMEEEKKAMAAKVREKFALLVQEKTALQEKCEQLEKQLAMGGRSGDQEVDGLRDKVVQLQFQLDKMTESRQELERKIREKIAAIVEEKNNALDRLKAIEASAGVGAGAESEAIRERMTYLVNENDKYMAKISELEAKVATAKTTLIQVETYYKTQYAQAQADLTRAHSDMARVRTYVSTIVQQKETSDNALKSLNEKKNRLETAVTELYTRLKTKEQRVVELEAMAQFDKTGGKTNINADLLTKVGELTATLSTVEMERKNWQREMDALKAENEKLNEQVAQMTAQCKTYDDRIKTLETDLQSAGKEREVLRDQTLKMAKSEPATAAAAGGDDLLKEEEVDEDEKEGRLVLVRSDTGNPQIRGGTVKTLVKKLTVQKYPDPEYMPAFLLTYKSFMTPDEFLDELIAQYNRQAPAGLNEQDMNEFIESEIKPIRLRVFNVMKNWVEKHFHDFDDQNLRKKLVDFVDQMIKGNDASMAKLAQSLQRLVEKKISGEDDTTKLYTTQPPPKATIAKTVALGSVNFTDLPPIEIARHLTLIEFQLFKDIESKELMGQAWNKKDKESRAPHVVRMIRRFNEVGNWVTTEIVQCDNIKTRTAALEKFIKVCQTLREMNNFNGVMEIIAGLQSSAVHRLKKTWSNVKAKTTERFEEYRDLMSNRGSYKAFRDALHHAEPPCIPYLGVYLTDLTFIEDGNPDWLNEENKVINFNKRRKVASVIREINQYQMNPYIVDEVPAVTDYLQTRQGLTEDEAYNLSLSAEPRTNV